MGFLKGTNTFEIGKLKLGSTNIDRIYFGSNYVWPPTAPEPDPTPIFTNTGVLTWERSTFTLAVADINLQREQVLQASGIGGDQNKKILCSDNYEHIILGSGFSNEVPYVSNNYGVSFYQTTGLPPSIIYTTQMSKSGKYIYQSVGNSPSVLYRSSNFGQSFEEIFTAPVIDNFNISHSGKDVLLGVTVTADDDRLYLSNDYGNTFSDITNLILPSGESTRSATEGILVSGDGLLMAALSANQDFPHKISLDSGQTWQTAGLSFKRDWGIACASYTGQYSLLISQGAGSGVVVSSTSLGSSYTNLNYNASDASISNSGQYGLIYARNNTGGRLWYNSTNYLGGFQQIAPSHEITSARIFN